MTAMLPAIVIAGIGLMLLLLVALTVAPAARRFTKARSELRRDLTAGTTRLQALVNARTRR